MLLLFLTIGIVVGAGTVVGVLLLTPFAERLACQPTPDALDAITAGGMDAAVFVIATVTRHLPTDNLGGLALILAGVFLLIGAVAQLLS